MTSRNQDRAQWYRIDLHTHTPASADYHQPEISYIDILQRAEMRGIDIIAFTDHNTVSGYAAMRREIEQLQFLVARGRATTDEQRTLEEYHRLLENILVLPGFEFTATFGFHILGIFPPDTPMRKLEHVLLDLRVPYEAIERGLTEVGASSDVLAAYRAIREAGGIAIAAHVNAAHGVAMWNMDFGGQTRIAYTQDANLHALEVTDLSKRGRFATQNFFNGNKPEYPRPMRCIQGSDAHRLDSQTDRMGKIINFGVGERPTEARLRDRSFAALRDMLEDDDFGATRAYTPALKPKDPLLSAFAEGATQTQALHESATQSGVLRLNILSDICAFANSQGGTIYLGVSDTRRVPVGVENPAQIIEQIIRATSLMMIPPINLVMGTVEANGKTIVRVQVPRGTERPYALEGSRIYLRSGHETRLATRDEIIALVMDSRSRGSVPSSTPAAIAATEPEAPRPIREERRSDARPRREERRDRDGRRPLPPPFDVAETAAPAPAAEEQPVYRAPEQEERSPRPERAERPMREDRVTRPERQERPMREGRSARAPEAPQQAVATVSDADLPRVGVELIAVEPRSGLNIYTLRDLQTKAIVKNITRVTKAKAWQYVIKQNETNPVQLERVRWNGPCGLWRKYRRLTEVRYDLVLQTGESVRYFYGIPESELRGGWAVFAQAEAQPEDGAAVETPSSQERQDIIEPQSHEEREVIADVPVPEAVEVPMPIVQIAQEAHGVDGDDDAADDEAGEIGDVVAEATADAPAKKKRRRRGGRRRNKGGAAAAAAEAVATAAEVPVIVEPPVAPVLPEASEPQRREERKQDQPQRRGGRRDKGQSEQVAQTQAEVAPVVETVMPAAVVPDTPAASEAKPAQVRNRRGGAGARKRHAPSLADAPAPAESAPAAPAQQAADAVKARKRGRTAPVASEPVAPPPPPEPAPEAPTAEASKPKRRSGSRKKGEG